MVTNLHFINSANCSSITKITLTSLYGLQLGDTKGHHPLVSYYFSHPFNFLEKRQPEKMESSIPVTIPCGLNSHPVDQGSNAHQTFLPRSCSQSLVGRQNSLVISGSFFGASSINHPRYFFIHFLYYL